MYGMKVVICLLPPDMARVDFSDLCQPGHF
jgi:hypothetical protein